jgi:F-type H+-transporting ATPase subunit gamma
MQRAITIRENLRQIETVSGLTQVFEGIASIHIAKIRDFVVRNKQFFDELWHTYEELRVDPKQQLRRQKQAKNARDMLVVITGNGKLSGENDAKIIAAMREAYVDPENTDIMAIGAHGAAEIRRLGLPIALAFELPANDVDFSVTPMAEVLNPYRRITAFYQTYESLRVQKPAKIELISAIRELGETVSSETDEEVVSSRDYIFEPGIEKIADYMESTMLGIALTQIIMDAKLSQYAARYNAMTRAKRRATDMMHDERLVYFRAKRSEADEQLKEVTKVARFRGSRR